MHYREKGESVVEVHDMGKTPTNGREEKRKEDTGSGYIRHGRYRCSVARRWKRGESVEVNVVARGRTAKI